MGWLYRGHDDRLDRDVWVKTLSPTVTNDPMARARFMREARIAASLCHRNIIDIMECGEYEGMPFIVFEALEGNSLLEAMNPGISLKAGLPVILQVLDGLGYMHARGIIHRDIKPASIFTQSDGAAKIVDFGLARLTDSMAGSGRSRRTAIPTPVPCGRTSDLR
jgi:serine/threonine protein kinase